MSLLRLSFYKSTCRNGGGRSYSPVSREAFPCTGPDWYVNASDSVDSIEIMVNRDS